MYTTFEQVEQERLLKGRSLSTLEFDKILAKLSALASSSGGRELCEALLPTSHLEMVNQWQKDTDCTVKYILSEGRLPLSGIWDIRSSLSLSTAQGLLSMKSLLAIACFLRAVERMRSILPREGETDPDNGLFSRVRSLVTVPSLEKEISFAILSEEEMNDRASDALYQIRRKIRDLQSGVRDTLERIIRNHSSALQEQLITLRGERYVVPVKAEKRGEIPGIVHDTSSSGQTVFVEPIAVVEANNKIRELITAENAEIERILQALSCKVAEKVTELTLDQALISEIDFLSAKATLAIEMKASRPILNTQGRVVLRKARHPLIDPKTVVPIDFSIGRDFRTLVITGPNTGGKTVSLKTCGLLCLMAMAGLQIPALDHSEVSVFEKVLADIGDEQSIEQSLSTFSSHMRNLVSILSETKPSTLVLVDELGSGTDPSEGAALAIAILDHLRKLGAVTVATTHYKELKGYAVETDGVENACCEFDTDTLSPTYRLLIGLPGVSNAFLISRKLGLEAEIIDAAQTLLSEEGIRFEELLSAAEQNNRESERLKKEIRDMRDHVKEQERKVQAELEEMDKKKASILREAREEKKELLNEALDEVDEMIKELRRAVTENEKQEAEDKMRRIRQNLRAGLSVLDEDLKESRDSRAVPGEKPDEIRSGGLYYAPALDIVGTVVKGPDSRGMCVIQSGSVRVNVKASDLRYPDENKIGSKSPSNSSSRATSSAVRKATKSSANELRFQKASTTTPEIMLIGMTVDEATQTLDHYIDDCVLSNMQTIRIVHGKGTGALRAAVTKLLQKDKRVSAFRLGTYGEGEDGVTIAQL